MGRPLPSKFVNIKDFVWWLTHEKTLKNGKPYQQVRQEVFDCMRPGRYAELVEKNWNAFPNDLKSTTKK